MAATELRSIYLLVGNALSCLHFVQYVHWRTYVGIAQLPQDAGVMDFESSGRASDGSAYAVSI
jgi:hypothetical protein